MCCRLLLLACLASRSLLSSTCAFSTRSSCGNAHLQERDQQLGRERSLAPCPAPPPRPLQRVHIRAGETVTVYIAANGVSFTQAMEDGSRVAWPGLYTVRFGVAETSPHGMGFAEVKVLAK